MQNVNNTPIIIYHLWFLFLKVVADFFYTTFIHVFYFVFFLIFLQVSQCFYKSEWGEHGKASARSYFDFQK